ncbi:MAG: type VI secretion system contractile sheath large subunit [Planctomycetes bacterium]|nr:type VI secretion system contractile sheath large subunit [Planctomycetota bacterium]
MSHSPGAPANPPAINAERRYRIVYLADLGFGRPDAACASVDKDTFAEWMAGAGVAAAVSVKNPLGGSDIESRLAFGSMRGFSPCVLLEQIAPGRLRLALREKVAARRVGGISPGELEEALKVGAGTDASLAWLLERSGGSAALAGGSVLDMIDEAPASAGVAEDVAQIAAAAGRGASGLSAEEAARLGQIQTRLDRELRLLADALLKHPDVWRLETAWRSVKYVVDHVDFRAGNRLSVVHTTRDALVDRLIAQVIDPVFEGTQETPGLIVLDFGLTNTPPHIEQLHEVAQHAAGVPVPVVFPVEADFFGVKSLRLVRNLPNFSGLLDGFQFAKWKALRDEDYAKSLAPVVGKFILRAPYVADPKAAAFSHHEAVAANTDLLWAGGHVALAVCAARAFAAHGWPTRMFGAEAGRIADLPVVQNPNDRNSPWGPGDLVLPDARLDELPAAGMNALMSIPGKDYCLLLGGVTARRAVVSQQVGKQQAALLISLPYQQFGNIASAWLCEQLPDLKGLDTETVQMRLLVGLQGLLGLSAKDAGESIAVGVGRSPNDPNRTLVQVRVTPPGKIVPGGLELDFGFEL